MLKIQKLFQKFRDEGDTVAKELACYASYQLSMATSHAFFVKSKRMRLLYIPKSAGFYKELQKQFYTQDKKKWAEIRKRHFHHSNK